MTEAQAAAATTVFLSYSRKDAAFRDWLAAAMEVRRYKPIFDQSHRPADDPDLILSAQDEWWVSLKTMIAASDVMVFVVTPESAKSPVCDDEIAYAKSLGKRVIGILRRTVDFNVAPERLRALNVQIDFRSDEESDSTQALDALCAEIDSDIEWLRRGNRLMRQAAQWESDGRPEGQLLRAGAVADADGWAARRPRQAPEPGELLLSYLQASREHERQQRDNQRRAIGRAFVYPAQQAVLEGRFDAALRLAAAGLVLSEDDDLRLVPELGTIGLFQSAALEDRTLAILQGHEDGAEVTGAAFSPDGTRIVTWSSDQGGASDSDDTARVWDAVTGTEITALRPDVTVSKAAFSMDGTRVLTAQYARGAAQLWDAATGSELAVLGGHENDEPISAAWGPDGLRIVTNNSRDGAARLWDAATGSEIAVLRGHRDNSYNATFSPNGTQIVTWASGDSPARVWDASSGREIAVLRWHQHDWRDAAFSPDGGRIVMLLSDGTCRVWDTATGSELAVLRNPVFELDSPAFSPDGTRIVTRSNDGEAHVAHVWDAATGGELAVLHGHDQHVKSVAFSRDGTRIVTASSDRTARVWDAATGSELAVLRGHDRTVNQAAFSPDGTRILTTSNDSTARVWKAETEDPALGILRGHERRVTAAAFGRDGTRLVTWTGNTVRVWDTATMSQIVDLGAYSGELDPAGTRIVTRAGDRTARVWDVTSGDEIAVLRGHRDDVLGAKFSPDGARVVTWAGDRTARVWDAERGSAIALLRGHEDGLAAAAFSPDGSRIVTASEDGTARVWDAATGSELAVLRGHEDKLVAAAFSPDGSRIVTASEDGTARVWDAATGSELTVLRGHEEQILEAWFNPDGTRLVTCSYGDGTCRIWDAVTGSEIVVLRGEVVWAQETAFSENGTRIVTKSDDNTARVWDTVTGNELAVLRGHKGRVNSAAFSRDGTRIVTASSDYTSRVWDAATGSELAVLRGHEDELISAAFSPDATRIVTTSFDRTARLWDGEKLPEFIGTPSVVLAAAIANNKGRQTAVERQNLLMQSAPEDLFTALMQRLSEVDRMEVHKRVALLSSPRHRTSNSPFNAGPERTEQENLTPSTPDPRKRSRRMIFVLLALFLVAVAGMVVGAFVYADDLALGLNWLLATISDQLAKVGF